MAVGTVERGSAGSAAQVVHRCKRCQKPVVMALAGRFQLRGTCVEVSLRGGLQDVSGYCVFCNQPYRVQYRP